MVHPSIIAAHAEIHSCHAQSNYSYDSDCHPDWVVEVSDSVKLQIKNLKINLAVLSSILEETLIEAMTEAHISANIEAAIYHEDYEHTLKNLPW